MTSAIVRIPAALAAAVALAGGCGGSQEEVSNEAVAATLEDCVKSWNVGDAGLGIPGIAAEPGQFAGAAISVRVRPEPRPCVISIENDLRGWYQIAFRPDRALSAQSVLVKRSGSFNVPFTSFGPVNAHADASGRVELSSR